MRSHKALRKAREFINAQGGEIAPLSLSEEELNPPFQDDLSLRVVPLESTKNCYLVDYNYPEESNKSEFSFFEDGKQRTIQIGYIQTHYGNHNLLIPVHYFIVASVILHRENRHLKVWQNALLNEGILVEKSLIPDQSIIDNFESMGLSIVDVGSDGGADYYNLRRRALIAAKKLRLEVENKLIGQWCNSEEANNKFLVVDGTLMNFRNEDNVERCIGVSKSFGSRYFKISEHNCIIQMNEFERSWIFRFHSPEDPDDDASLGARDRLSWYLRLRMQPNKEPEFGLVRIEISQRHTKSASEYADRFSKSILSERLPTSYPFPRWDKHLYPIRECENYLSSIIPSIDTIRASMKG